MSFSTTLSEQPTSIYSLIPAPVSEEPDPAHYKVTDLGGYSLGLPGGFLCYTECAGKTEFLFSQPHKSL